MYHFLDLRFRENAIVSALKWFETAPVNGQKRLKNSDQNDDKTDTKTDPDIVSNMDLY